MTALVLLAMPPLHETVPFPHFTPYPHLNCFMGVLFSANFQQLERCVVGTRRWAQCRERTERPASDACTAVIDSGRAVFNAQHSVARTIRPPIHPSAAAEPPVPLCL
jgi:hypothetical protein